MDGHIVGGSRFMDDVVNEEELKTDRERLEGCIVLLLIGFLFSLIVLCWAVIIVLLR